MPALERMQKLCRGHIAGLMMAGSMHKNAVFLKDAGMLIKIAMPMFCLTWHPATCFSLKHGIAFQRYVLCRFMLANYFIMSYVICITSLSLPCYEHCGIWQFCVCKGCCWLCDTDGVCPV